MTKDMHGSQKTEDAERHHRALAQQTPLGLDTSAVEIRHFQYNILDFLIIIFLV